jgi:hypothetical protein
MEGRDPLIHKAYGEKSLVADKISADDHVASYVNPWEPEYFSRLEDATPASSPMDFDGIFADNDDAVLDAEPIAGIWSLCVRADQLWNKRLGTLKITGDPDGDLCLSIS